MDSMDNVVSSVSLANVSYFYFANLNSVCTLCRKCISLNVND